MGDDRRDWRSNCDPATRLDSELTSSGWRVGSEQSTSKYVPASYRLYGNSRSSRYSYLSPTGNSWAPIYSYLPGISFISLAWIAPSSSFTRRTRGSGPKKLDHVRHRMSTWDAPCNGASEVQVPVHIRSHPTHRDGRNTTILDRYQTDASKVRTSISAESAARQCSCVSAVSSQFQS